MNNIYREGQNNTGFACHKIDLVKLGIRFDFFCSFILKLKILSPSSSLL